MSAVSDSDDDVPTLSAHTLAALQEFYEETQSPPAASRPSSEQFAVGAVEEDWVSDVLKQWSVLLTYLLTYLCMMCTKPVIGSVCPPADEPVLVQ